MVDIICLGEPLIEFNQIQDGSWIQGFGGDTSNCAISASRQGAKVGYITKVGSDHFGDLLIDLWKAEHIDVSHIVRDPDSPTGIYFVTHDENGHHFTYYRKHSAASLMNRSDISQSYIVGAKMLHVSAISQAISKFAADAVMKAIDYALSSDTTVSYDTNLRLNLWPEERAREVIHHAMSKCHLALPSYEDAVVLTKLKKPDDIVDFYLKLGAKTVVLKCGREGALVSTHDRRENITGIKVDSVDANGAGDTFAGALLAELVRGKSPFEAAQFANAAAALSTQSKGAVNAIPNRDQVKEFLVSRSATDQRRNP